MDPIQNSELKKYSPITKWSLVIGIVIVINLFFNYAISLIYDAPKYEDYCKPEQVIEAVTTKDACVAKGGQWDENYYGKPVVVGETVSPGYCNLQFTCQNEFEADRQVYERNVFVTLVVLGIILVVVSFILSFNSVLSISASLGGILSVIIASVRYWAEADNWLRVIILFIALVVLIYLAVRRFKN